MGFKFWQTLKSKAVDDLISFLIPVSCFDIVLTVTSMYVPCEKLAEVLGWARWEFRALLDRQLETCLLFTHDEEKVHEWGVVHIFCVSQCVKSRWVVVYFNIMNGCIFGFMLLMALRRESAQTPAFKEGMS